MTELIQIPALRDNYIYLLQDGEDGVVIDPAEATPVLRTLDERGCRLLAVLNTHHHADHTGGNRELARATGARIFGPAEDADRFPGLTDGVRPDEDVTIGPFSFRVLDVRAHTRSHVAYAPVRPLTRVIRHGHAGIPTEVPHLAQRPALFVGDTLFLGGCGRLFEGSAEDLTRAMQKIAAEPADSVICCAHEYTAANLRFAIRVWPESLALHDRLATLDQEMGPARSSVPDLLSREHQTNPFLASVGLEARRQIAAHLGVEHADLSGVLGALRAQKDRA